MSDIEEVNFPAGAVIFKEGDKPDSVFFVISGALEVSRTESGAKLVLGSLAANSVFGEMALIDSKPRSATVMATVPTVCYKAVAANFSALITKIDPTVRSMMQQMVAIIREKNQVTKVNMTPADIAALNALKQKAGALKTQIFGNPALLENVKKLNPFLNGIFNSLLQLLVA